MLKPVSYTNWQEAIAASLGEKIGTEITQGDAEKMFFPFYGAFPWGKGYILSPTGNNLAYTLLYGEEKCVYKVVNAEDYNKWLSLEFNGVKIGELTEVGVFRTDIITNGELKLLAEDDNGRRAEFYQSGFSLPVNNDNNSSSVSTLKFFGKKIHFLFSTITFPPESFIVVYVKYKPCRLYFDFTVSQSNSQYMYFAPCIGSGYFLKSFTVTPGMSDKTFHLYKKINDDPTNNTLIFETNDPLASKIGLYHFTPTGNANDLKTFYNDWYFGSDGSRAGEKVYMPYSIRLEFEGI